MTTINNKDLFPNIPAEVLDNDSKVRSSHPSFSDDFMAMCHSVHEFVNKLDDIRCPRRLDGSRQSDVETLMTTTNSMVYNTIAGTMKPVASASQQQPQLPPDQQAMLVMPAGSIAADVDSAYQGVGTLADAKAAVTPEPASSSLPSSSPDDSNSTPKS